VKKHSNSVKQCESSPRVSVLQDSRAIMSELVARLAKQLDGEHLPVAELQDEARNAARPKLCVFG
jgi:hypothetical protein